MYDLGKDLSGMVKEKAFDYGISKPEIPVFIAENIRHSLWRWQKEALENFLTQEKIKEKENNFEPTHLMFNMATGTGKTMLMAALILYYYKKGYRHFIFFVNQNNIVDKTENNFINKNHTKYLFRQNIVIDDKTINIRKVETFDDADDIQIKFTSIHKLHNAVYLAKENSVTLEDLQKKNLIMIGDEAHHLNASTIKNGQTEMDLPTELKENASEKDIEKSWENTALNKILRKGKNKQNIENRNVLLEFTATISKNEDVIEKYRTKTIYKFELVDFLKAGYTKEINLVSTSLKKEEKILLALLFNWYRHQIALKNNIANFKPVILFRSKFIEESKKDYKKFISLVGELKPSDFDFLKNIENSIKQDDLNSAKIYEQGKSHIKQMLKFIKNEKINIREIVKYIKDEFDERNCIITNSKDNKAITKEKTTEEQEQLLNSLEDKNNHIRAIFTVKRLTEGWDVLNLFDIVRLYKGRDEAHDKQSKKRKAGETTVQEIQLIGRGVRYFPFVYNEHEKNKRKFDNELQNPLRVLEEFYYHSDDDSHYLDELKRELKNKITSKNNFDDISNEEKLDLLLEFFDEFARKLKEIANPYIGTDFEALTFEQLFGEPKEKYINTEKYDKNYENEVLKNKWYVLDGFVGTSEEIGLFEFLKNRIVNLNEKYNEVYLLRNEEVYKIYDFEQGRGFEPDFLLFLKGKKGNLYYQIFIEPKGGQFTDKDGGFKDSKEGWKEEFLQQITDKYGNGDLLKAENKDYKLIGLPLFSKRDEVKFERVFSKQLNY